MPLPWNDGMLDEWNHGVFLNQIDIFNKPSSVFSYPIFQYFIISSFQFMIEANGFVQIPRIRLGGKNSGR
jgi:hypothetical protein